MRCLNIGWQRREETPLMRSHPLLDDRIEMLHRLTNAARTDANAERVCAVSDKDKKDKHEYQGGTTLPRVD